MLIKILLCLSLFIDGWAIEQRKLNLESRIVNGIPTTNDIWPWMVSIRLNNDHLCGGSIIRRSKPAAILTAGHCIEWFDIIEMEYMNIWIDIGRDDVTTDSTHYDSYKMSDYVFHPNISYDSYYQNTVIHDIGIIFIENALPSTQHIITLNKDIEWITDGDALITMGYGWNGWNTKMLTDTLEQTHMIYINDTECNIAIDKYFKRYWNLKNYTLFLKSIGIEYSNEDEYPYNILQCKECVLCAIGNDTDTCNGDSGSPLIKGTNKEDALQVGIVSYGFECNVKDVPAQYTDIAFYYDWIYNELNKSLQLHNNDAVIISNYLILFVVVFNVLI